MPASIRLLLKYASHWQRQPHTDKRERERREREREEHTDPSSVDRLHSVRNRAEFKHLHETLGDALKHNLREDTGWLTNVKKENVKNVTTTKRKEEKEEEETEMYTEMVHLLTVGKFIIFSEDRNVYALHLNAHCRCFF